MKTGQLWVGPSPRASWTRRGIHSQLAARCPYTPGAVVFERSTTLRTSWVSLQADAAFPSGARGARTALIAAGALLLVHGGNALAGGSSQLAVAVFWPLGIGVVAAVAARAFLIKSEREVWIPAAIAFVAWFAGTAYYTGWNRSLDSLSAFLGGDMVLLFFAAPAALAAGRLVQSRVDPFAPTILLDAFVVAIATSALGAALMAETLSRMTVEAHPGILKLAYPIAALLFLAFSVWIVGLSDWRPGRFWTLLMTGLGFLALASTAFVLAAGRGTYSAGGPLDTLWLAGALTIAIAAWQPAGEQLQVKLNALKRIGVTSFAALTALALLVLAQFANVTTMAVCFASAAVAGVIARAAVAFKENVQLFADARVQAQTDSLTGLGNRRKLMADLGEELKAASVESPRVLVIFDLDGFKRYNDTYGHPAGDSLLMRLGANLGRVIHAYGNAYRLGGDEFCVLVVTGASSAKTIISLAANALSEHGEGFSVRSSHGAVMLPHEARDATLALRIADQRMYAQKDDRRSSATRQTRDILLQILQEREPHLGDHLKGVAKLAMGIATRLEVGAEELEEIVRAAELHDVGKMAIPDEVLRKPGPLTEEEWAFVRQHTIIGERILGAAPALLPVAKLVRASHERFDGSGYPDGLAGDAIPLGARIVCVCDAFHAMTSVRPYRPAIPVEDALAELRACAGTQFDPRVVAACCDEIAALAPRYGGPLQNRAAVERPAA
jgi:two-component system, cell cycle response regulator